MPNTRSTTTEVCLNRTNSAHVRNLCRHIYKEILARPLSKVVANASALIVDEDDPSIAPMVNLSDYEAIKAAIASFDELTFTKILTSKTVSAAIFVFNKNIIYAEYILCIIRCPQLRLLSLPLPEASLSRSARI